MPEDILYSEKITSNRTEALFVALTVIFLLLFAWRVSAAGMDILAFVFTAIFIVFFFYSINYRVLVIRLTTKNLKLTFGIFSWKIPLGNIQDCHLDEIPMLMKMGGAGIHFMSIRRRYRASFNFLEYPRLVVVLKQKAGLVRDISFTTRQPDEIQRLIQESISANQAS